VLNEIIEKPFWKEISESPSIWIRNWSTNNEE
jgi:hypothetical protein